MTPADQQRFPPLAIPLRNGPPAVIRPLAEADGAALADFYAGIPAADAFFYGPHPLTREFALRNAAQAGSATEVVLVLEIPDGGIGGYAWYRWQATGEACSLVGICLARACQGAGAGQQLLARLNVIARTVGPPVMRLTVQQSNPKAIELYRKLGFQIIREQLRKDDGEPEYCMERVCR